MRGFVIGTIATAIAFAVMIWLLPKIDYQGDVFPGLIVIALIAGVVNGLIKPIVRLVSLPIRMMTLGLFGFVINAGLLLLIAWISSNLKFDFTIAGFPPDLSPEAVLWAGIGAVVLSLVSTVVGLVVHD
jgi:putative membrane protein